MATYSRLDLRSFTAGADLSLLQYSMLKLDVNGAVIPCAVAGEKAIGILANAPTLGQAAAILPLGQGGQFKVKLAGTVAIGDPIVTNNAGLGITSVTPGHAIVGFAETAGAAGDIISITVESGNIV